VVQLYEVGEYRGHPFQAWEYCDGGDLAARLTGTPWPPRQAAQLVKTLARAVHAVHEKQLLHLQLAPSEVFLAGGGGSAGLGAAPGSLPSLADLVPKVSGFRPAPKPEEAVASGTVGRPSYLAPEQVRPDGQPLGPATDVYGL